MRTGSLPAPAPRGADVGLRGLLHDLGHGLTTVSYLAEGLHAEDELPRAARERLEVVRRELARLLDLVATGAAPGDPVPVELRGLLTQLADAHRREGAPQVRLRPGGPVTVLADATAVWRMLANLVQNAVRAAGAGGAVELGIVRDRPDSGTATVEVLDDGPGLGRGPAGSDGLGLGIVTRLARACGARLRLDPAPSGGTRARLVFPAA
ncbi:sensor histidine kinase [Saccharopolyspora sp. MS10]|uniref:sensor histidine kinase n=1 Tax=Saccharopolyspora sp. MS10 TaxID=3385973 RepID=UPI00399F34EB